MTKKKKSSTPRCKRMKRNQRLQSAKQWILTYRGKSLVRGYKNHFGVDQVCALLELKALGERIDEEQIKKARKTVIQKGESKIVKLCDAKLVHYPDPDDCHYFVAGHTSGGIAYARRSHQMNA